MICYNPSSRKERRQLYVQVLKTSQFPQRISYLQFRNENQRLAAQIHVDSKRALWHFFNQEELSKHLQDSEYKLENITNYNGLVRFHQRFLELFTIDVINNIPNKNYFQGLNQILACFYFIFVKEEYFLESNDQIQQYYKIHKSESNDFIEIEEGVDDILYNYNSALSFAVSLCENSLSPLFENNLSKLSDYVQLTFEPFMRLIDSQLYELISNEQAICEIAPSLLMGSLLSHMQYNVNSIASALRFMDATVHGDWITILLVATSALSLSVRYRNPTLFKNQVNKLSTISDSEQLKKLQLDDNEDNDILHRIMSSLDHGEKILLNYADESIRLAMVAYYIIHVSQYYADEQKIFKFINSNFNINKTCIKNFKHLQHKQERLQTIYCNKVNNNIIEDIRGVDGDIQYFLDYIMNSVTYNIQNESAIRRVNFKNQFNIQLLTFNINTKKAFRKAGKQIKTGFTNMFSKIKDYFQESANEIQPADSPSSVVEEIQEKDNVQTIQSEEKVEVVQEQAIQVETCETVAVEKEVKTGEQQVQEEIQTEIVQPSQKQNKKNQKNQSQPTETEEQNQNDE